MGNPTKNIQPLADSQQTKDPIRFPSPEGSESFIHNLPDALIEADLATRQITYMNGLAGVLFGLKQKDIDRGIHASKLFIKKAEFDRAVEIAKQYALSSYENKTEYVRSRKQDHYYFEMKKGDGSPFAVEAQGAFILDKNNVPAKIRILIREVVGIKHLSESHKRRRNILDAISYGTHLFLEKSSWEYYIAELVNRLGMATEVSRVYVFENHSGPNGELLTSQKYEWVDRGVKAQLDNPDLQNFPLKERGFGRWVNTLEKGEIISGLVKNFPKTEREILKPQEIISILITPIFVSGCWWGFIGFDDCTKERKWSSVIKIALKTAADTIGTTILRKQSEAALEESEKKHRSIIETMEEGYFELDIAGNFTFVNEAICKLTGYSREELLGMNYKEYTSLETAERMYGIYTTIYETGKPAKITDHEIIVKDGSKRFLEMSSSLIRDRSGEPIGFRGLTRDVTERKRSERAIKQSEQSYKALSEKLTKTNTMKELLLDIITHDLMNPAGVISGMSEMLEDEFPDNSMAGVIRESSENLISVIKNATTLSKISMGEKIKMEVLDLAQIIKEAAPEFSLQLKESGMTCEFKLPETIRVKANPIIAEVFKNYISNAIKYSADGKRILFKSSESKSAVTINVIDFGPTVPEEKRELIFEREFQLDHKTRKGMGLGLAIVKRIAMAHNAVAGVKPNKPKGNIFYIKIPKNL
jgi:PAS domain S-box-containing protein